jgi:hypothetical protein
LDIQYNIFFCCFPFIKTIPSLLVVECKQTTKYHTHTNTTHTNTRNGTAKSKRLLITTSYQLPSTVIIYHHFSSLAFLTTTTTTSITMTVLLFPSFESLFVHYHATTLLATVPTAFRFAMVSALTLSLSHLICVAIVMYYDLTGQWEPYKLHKSRNVTYQDYINGLMNFAKDLVLLFVPFLTFCYTMRIEAIQGG